MTYISGGGGFTDFSGNAGKFLRVNATEDDLEAAALAGGGDMVGSNNLSDLTDDATARGNLGVPTLAEVLLAVYPVGSIYTSISGTNPGTLFGGTWAAFGAGKTLVGLNSGDTDFDTPEETGGAKTKAISAHSGTAVGNHTFTQPTVAWPAGVPTASGAAVADHAAHTHSVTSNVAVSDHASHTHTYTDVPNHVHVQNVNTGTTGSNNGYGVDTSTSGSGATAISTANPTGGVATGTTAGPNAALAHTVTNNAVTSGNPSAALTHSVTQPTIAWPAGVPTNSGGAVSAHSVTQPDNHTDLNVVQPYIVVYFFKRTA